MESGTVTWITNDVTKITTSGNSSKYEEGTVGDVIDKLGEKGDGKDSFIGLLDVEFKIPNTNRSEPAGENLDSGAEWLFTLLQKDPNSQYLENIMRYALYKYNGKDYGVTTFDFSIFRIEKFSSTSGSTQSLSNYLRQFSHSDEAPQSSDGKYYLMYGDGKGWPTIGNADLQWKSHHGKFNVEGSVLENGVEKTVPNIEQYVNGYLTKGADAEYTNEEVSKMQIYVEKSVVDDIGDSVQKTYYDYVANCTQGFNLSKQQLYALTTIAYNFGSLPKRNGYTFKEVYEAGAAQYEVNSCEHNKFIWDNWWCHLGGGAPGHIPSRDAAFETYVKGVYKFSESNAGTVFGRKYYIYYTQEQLNEFSYAPTKSITRTSANEEEIFTYVKRAGSGILDVAEELHTIMENEMWTYSVGGDLYWYNIELSTNNPNKVTCCATYVGSVLYVGGYLTEEEANSFNYNSAPSFYNYLKNVKQWEQITTYEDLEPGDIVFMSTPKGEKGKVGHVQIYAGDNKWYNAGSTEAIQRESPYTSGVSYIKNLFVCAFRAN